MFCFKNMKNNKGRVEDFRMGVALFSTTPFCCGTKDWEWRYGNLG